MNVFNGLTFFSVVVWQENTWLQSLLVVEVQLFFLVNVFNNQLINCRPQFLVCHHPIWILLSLCCVETFTVFELIYDGFKLMQFVLVHFVFKVEKLDFSWRRRRSCFVFLQLMLLLIVELCHSCVHLTYERVMSCSLRLVPTRDQLTAVRHVGRIISNSDQVAGANINISCQHVQPQHSSTLVGSV